MYGRAVEFPSFLFADEPSVIEQAPKVGATWLTAWRSTGTLGSVADRRIEPGELVIVYAGELDSVTPYCRLFGAEQAVQSVLRGLADPTRTEFEASVLETPWGALAECSRLRPPNTVAAVTRRARALLAQWSALGTLRYIGIPKPLPEIVTLPGLNQDLIGLDQLVAEMFAGPLAMWAPEAGPVRMRLEHALDAMAAITPEEARVRVLARMLTAAARHPRFRGKPAADPAAITARAETLSATEWAALTPCVDADLLDVPYALWHEQRRRR
jgi:hypothetical protein